MRTRSSCSSPRMVLSRSTHCPPLIQGLIPYSWSHLALTSELGSVKSGRQEQGGVNGGPVYDVVSGTASLYEWTLPAGAGGGANGIRASAGSIWLAGFNGLVKWDEAANQFTTWPIPAHPSTAAAFLDVDNVGQIWYTSHSSDASSTNNYVGVLRGDNTFKEWQVPTTGAEVRGININPLSQSPWVAEQGSSKIGVLDLSAGGSVTSALSTTTPFTPVLGSSCHVDGRGGGCSHKRRGSVD